MVGGNTLKDNVKRVMDKLMTTEVMANYNITGSNRSGLNKLAFENLCLYAVVIESVQKSTQQTEADIAKEVANCLRYAPDRKGGGGRKKKCKKV